jgi:uncharacterized protein YprB with RNaseH-like and TPR domain
LIKEQKERDQADYERQKSKWAAAEQKPKRTAMLSPDFNNERIEAFKASETNEPYFFIFDCETTGLPQATICSGYMLYLDSRTEA